MAFKLNLDTPITFVKGVGEARAAAFSRLGIETAGDLLMYFPAGFENRGKIVPISSALEGELCAFEVTVLETSAPKRLRGNMSVFRSTVEDGSGKLDLVFFNQPFLAKSLTVGRRYRVFGRVKLGLYRSEMISPKLEPILPNVPLRDLVPIYRLATPLTRKIVENAVSEVLPLCESLAELLPESVRKSRGLMARSEAVLAMHRPRNEQELLLARRTLAISEVAVFRLALSGMRSDTKKEKAFSLTLKNSGIKHFFESLPFELTGAQKRSVKEIFADLSCDTPMARLLQGDVGSGKTAVAAASIFLCVKNGYQACLMAPTEILAAQHKKTLDSFLEPFGITTALLTSGLPASEKRRVRAGLSDGSINVAIGTHALITEDTAFSNCALAVVDEQHRFGVKQRAELLKKSEHNGRRAHMLVMSATPIPRSLSLIIFGDLDISVLDELPPGRQKIETRVVPQQNASRVYEFVRDEIASGGRAYIVCSLIEDSDDGNGDRRAAESFFAELSNGALKGIPMGLLHGRMKPTEKASVMADFASGKTKALVSTTVIEVGVDVPEATVMVVENAELFGLSQLHQLRGRIGRGNKKSYCFLINGGKGNDSADRLAVMRDTSDGFKVAEADLQKRGPGDFFGVRQSGEFSFAISLVADPSLLSETDELLEEIKRNRDNPQYAELFRETRKFLERNGGAITVN